MHEHQRHYPGRLPRLGADNGLGRPLSVAHLHPRHYQWASVFDHRVHENPYAIIGGGSITERRTDVSDGVNEFGLMAQKLTFKNGARLVDERHPDKVQLAAFELIFLLARPL